MFMTHTHTHRFDTLYAGAKAEMVEALTGADA